MVKYLVAMSIRIVCIALVVIVPDWWKLIPAIGAVALPYFAVVVANNASRTSRTSVLRPGALLRRASGRDAA